MKKIKIDYKELIDTVSADFNDCGAYKWLENAFAMRLVDAGVELDKIHLPDVVDALVVQMEEDLLEDFEQQFNSSYYNKGEDGNQLYELEYFND